MPDIVVFNTKSRQKETFFPLKEGEVTIYHCGPTVYHFQHIGNMRRFIFADLTHRMFIANNYKTKQVINITDVGHLVSDGNDGEDKMEKGAKREGKTAQEIAAMYTADFMEDLALLNIRTDNTLFPKATENIPEQIDMIRTLEEKGFAYKISDGIYFDTSKDECYADFAHLDLRGMKDGGRIGENSEKRNPADFALWKFSPSEDTGEKRQQEWESPWGTGFPGWHIECSAMAKKFLGTTIDLHTGGIDHIPVHHTNEITQSENANYAPFVRYWMHNEHVDFGNAKIAKSGDSFIRLKDLMEKKYHPLAFRYFTLLAHYRTKINFTFEALDAAAVAWKKLNAFVSRTKDDGIDGDLSRFDTALAALNDDLDTPKIVALIWEILKDSELTDPEKKAAILKIDGLIGIIDPNYATEESVPIDSLPEDVKKLIEERDEARKNKDWKKSDELREKIRECGFEMQDGADGAFISKSL